MHIDRKMSAHIKTIGFSHHLKSVANLLFFIYGVLVILMQGCFSPVLTIAFGSVLLVLLCFVKKPPVGACLLPVMLLMAFSALTPVFRNDVFFTTTAEIFKWILLICSAIAFYSEYKRPLFYGVYFGVSFSALIGILAYFKIIPAELFDTVQLAAEVDGVFQLFSVFGYSNTAAVFFGSAVFVGLKLIDEHNPPPWLNILIPLNALALYFTHSNFAFVFFVFSAVGYYMSKRKKTKLFAILSLILFVVTLTVIVVFRINPGSTVISRIIYSLDAMKALKPFGIGFGNWSELKYSVQTAIYSTDFLHNGYLQLLLEGGIQAFLPFIIFVFMLIRSAVHSENSAAFSITLFILLHAFTDIDMAYGALYILLGFASASVFPCYSPKKFFRPCLLIFSVIAVITAGVAVNGLSVHPTDDYYRKRIENGSVTVGEISALYKGAKEVHDAQSMYYFSLLWLDKAPKSQEAFDAAYESIDKIYAATLDENYLTVSRPALYKRMELANSSMNKLCRYLEKNQRIELP